LLPDGLLLDPPTAAQQDQDQQAEPITHEYGLISFATSALPALFLAMILDQATSMYPIAGF